MKISDLQTIILAQTNPNPSTTLPPSSINPHAQTSSFYGPGAFLCWLLISLSYTLQWATVPTPQNIKHLPLTSDFFAMLAYPAIAAIHSMYLAATFPPSDRSLIFANMTALRSPLVNQTNVGDDVLASSTMEMLQASVALAAPLRVCEIFLYPGLLILVFVIASVVDGREYRSSPRLLEALYAVVYGVVVLSVVVVMGMGKRGGAAVGEYLARVIDSHIAVYAVVGGTVGLPVYSVYRWREDDLWELVVFDEECHPVFLIGLFPALYFAGLFVAPFVVIGMFPGDVVGVLANAVPDAGVSLWELDQAATACVGCVTLGISMYEASKTVRSC